MRFRVRAAGGKVLSLPDVASLVKAIRTGTVGPDTPMSVGKQRSWHPAGRVAAYREAFAAVNRAPAERFPASRLVELRTTRRTPWAYAVLGAGLISLGGFGAFRVLGKHEKPPALATAAPTVSGLRANARLRVYSFQFGDSVAVELRQLQDWLAGQRLEPKLRGAALKRPGSLQAARSAGAGFLLRLDSLEAHSTALAVRLVARADSIEAAGGFDGLASALEDELARWSRDFAGYTEIMRGVGAALDSLPAFLLEKQGAFAVWEGKAAFLSREDAARFAMLEARFVDLAGRELTWSTTLLAKRPDWMSGVLEDERPRFGRPVLALQ
jgi:hypothetical protein